MEDANTASLMDIIGVTHEVARGLLEITGGDLSQACTIYFDNPDVVKSFPSVTLTAPSGGSASGGPAPRDAGREDEHGVIHIDSDDEDDGGIQMFNGTSTATGTGQNINAYEADAAAAATVARSAQEDEDAAFARRLQEELYSGAGGAAGGAGGLSGRDDEIRAPIASTMDTLVGPDTGVYNPMLARGVGYVEDDEDDRAAEAAFLAEMRRQRQVRNAARVGRNPFGQSVWDGDDAPSRVGGLNAGDGNGGATTSTRQRLADLFRPPTDLVTHLGWDDTRDEGKVQKKWILVNLQDMTDFKCQMLNRDHWKDQVIRQIIQDRFLFLQFDKDDFSASQYITLYMPTEQHNINNYPHVAVIDPRTGEQMKVWSGSSFPDVGDFRAQLSEFLERYKFEGKNPVASAQAAVETRRKQRENSGVIDVDRMTEDEMLQLAMQNSLEAANGGASGAGSGAASGSSSSLARRGVYDPDELTKSSSSSIYGPKRKATEDPVAPSSGPPSPTPDVAGAATTTTSRFAAIPSDMPHQEPPNGPGITRIQFMHPGGRVVRRFDPKDPVSRVYEWLKAEPLGGEERFRGVEFELKRMPQGRDLIDDLDKTIEEAGIKQSTLAVEFMEN